MAKEKRLKKKLKREFSAGGAVFRKDDSEALWLVIKPSGKNTWRLPKGLIDRGETSIEAAQREVEEEAGVETEVIGKIGQDKYFYNMGRELIYKMVTYYLMRYLADSKSPISWETEEIEWLPFEEALTRLTFRGEKEILQKAKELLEQGSPSQS